MITLATLKDATAQQVFDQVSTHLLTQMKQSSGYDRHEDFQCYYRSGEGRSLKCAAGCLIADDEYVLAMDEPYKCSGTAWEAIIEAGHAPRTHELLITQLQWVHDSFLPLAWAEHLKELATEFGLEYDHAA